MQSLQDATNSTSAADCARLVLDVVPVVMRPLRGAGATRNIFAAVRAGAQHDPVLAATLEALRTVAEGVSAIPLTA